MAERRMFAKTIIDSDAFLDMPLSAQALYFHLSMRADDDGFVNNPKKIQRMVGASDDDCKLLVMKRFVLTFESGIIVIKHWKIHNYIQKDRYKETVYLQEKASLRLNENKAYTECIHGVPAMDTQVRIGKVSQEKEEVKNSKRKNATSRFIPPTYDEVLLYAKERNREDLAKVFFDYFNAGGWVDSKGNAVRNWKQKFITWENRNDKPKGQPQAQPQLKIPSVGEKKYTAEEIAEMNRMFAEAEAEEDY